MFHLNWRPLPAVIGILAVEIFIGACVRDAWVRPYAGDVLAVVLVYASLRMVLAVPPPALATVSFLVGAIVEAIQYLGLPEIRHPLLAVIVGATFSMGRPGGLRRGCPHRLVDRRKDAMVVKTISDAQLVGRRP